MHLRRFLSVFVLATVIPLQAAGQDSPGFVRRVIDRLGKSSAALDPAAVYQPAPRWTFALTGDLRQAVTSQTRSFMTLYFDLDEAGNLIIDDTPIVFNSSLRGGLEKAVGLQVGYGSLNLALSKSFHGSKDDRTFSFDYQGAGLGLSVQYFKLSDLVDYNLIMGEEGDANYVTYDGTTAEPVRMRSFIVDAFYAFNRRTFAYSAAYKGYIQQRRSAGSWMIGSKLILSDYSLDPSELISLWSGGQARQSSAQVSFGGGYSFNFVPLHRQPSGDREKGLRNLTVNLTAIPMVTLFNQFTSTSYEYVGDDEFVTGGKDVINGKPMVNYVARVGVGYTHDLYTVNLSGSGDSYAYRGTSSIVYQGVANDEVETSGKFFRWSLALRLCKRF